MSTAAAICSGIGIIGSVLMLLAASDEQARMLPHEHARFDPFVTLMAGIATVIGAASLVGLVLAVKGGLFS